MLIFLLSFHFDHNHSLSNRLSQPMNMNMRQVHHKMELVLVRSLELDDQPKHWPLREPRGKQSSESIKMVDFRLAISGLCIHNELILFPQIKTQGTNDISRLRFMILKCENSHNSYLIFISLVAITNSSTCC